MNDEMPEFIHTLVKRLRRHGLPLGVDDCAALRAALASGHGLTSTGEFRRLCVLLWAKSSLDAELIAATLYIVPTPEWRVGAVPQADRRPSDGDSLRQARSTAIRDPTPKLELRESLHVAPVDEGAFEVPPTGRSAPFLVLNPRYPLAEREIAQTWRRLRRPIRHGPSIELDVGTTIDKYARTGVVDAPVMRPARGNAARLLLLIDRHGSMTPFHGLIDYVVSVIIASARLDSITVRYFHNVPGRSPDRRPLSHLFDPLSTNLDPIVSRVPALRGGRVYHDPGLAQPAPLAEALDACAPGSAVAVVSDAGAIRGSTSLARLYDTVSFLRAVGQRPVNLAWLNPAASFLWPAATAGRLARHVPMFPLTRSGMSEAVSVLHGRPRSVERPL
jgi:uncharacterized protein